MTDRQMTQAIRNAQKPIDYSSKWYREISARRMINSYLAYQCKDEKSAYNVLHYDEMHNRRHRYLEEYVKDLGEERMLELIQEQIDDILCVLENTLVDDENVSYNSIVWKDVSLGVN